jgi:hypothetical protein
VGSSFTSLGDHGFWASDSTLELWLVLLADEARRLDEPPAWLVEAARDWATQATIGMTGSLCAGLDGLATSPERTDLLVAIGERALASLEARGDPLSMEWLNSLGLGGPGAVFTGDPPLERFVVVGEHFLKLLRGELTWTAATSPLV